MTGPAATTTMAVCTFTAMIMARMMIIQPEMTILIVTMNTDIHTTIRMTTTLPAVMRPAIIATAITDTVIPICPPAPTERR